MQYLCSVFPDGKNVKEELSENWKRVSKVINKKSQEVVRKYFVDNIF